MCEAGKRSKAWQPVQVDDFPVCTGVVRACLDHFAPDRVDQVQRISGIANVEQGLNLHVGSKATNILCKIRVNRKGKRSIRRIELIDQGGQNFR
jgi:hypothetical protein